MLLNLSDMLSLERENTEEACLALHSSHHHGLVLEEQVGFQQSATGAHGGHHRERGAPWFEGALALVGARPSLRLEGYRHSEGLR